VQEPVVWYNGDMGGSATQNQRDGALQSSDATAYDNFTITAPVRVTSVFSNNLVNGGFIPIGAVWEIRSSVSAGNGGTVVSSGLTTSTFTWTPTGRTGNGFVEYSLLVRGLSVNLASGTYWLSVVPIGNRQGSSYISGTLGIHAVGVPRGNDRQSYVKSAFTNFGSYCFPNNPCDYSMGIASADAIPVPTRIGTYRTGRWVLDVTGNGALDSAGDRDFFLGWAGATIVNGDWNGDGKTKVGVYSDGYWFLDYDGNGLWDNGVKDKLIAWGWAGAAPMVGDWNGDGRTKIGVYSNGFWFLDYNGDYLWDGGVVDKQVGWGWAGVTPIVGDWNGDGKAKIGVYSGGYWYLDYDGNYLWQYPGADRVWSVGWTGTTPVMGDWNGDGKTKAGAFVNGYWYLDYDGNGLFEGIGSDRIFAFGSPGDVPVTGKW
jgi:hypothetical protein